LLGPSKAFDLQRKVCFMRAYLFLAVTCSIVLTSCNQTTLPVYGPKTAVQVTRNGQVMTDSIDYSLPNFQFTDQDSNTVDSNTIKGKIFVADFFFTSCPSICPKMMKEMDEVYSKYQTNGNVVILSYSIDPARDSVARLKKYEKKIGFSSKQWHLLTGNKDSIYNLADKFLVSAADDPDAPGGHIHSGNFILVDKHRRIRGYYDGTKEESVQKLMDEMDVLLKEKE
jgi:protein SCO1